MSTGETFYGKKISDVHTLNPGQAAKLENRSLFMVTRSTGMLTEEVRRKIEWVITGSQDLGVEFRQFPTGIPETMEEVRSITLHKRTPAGNTSTIKTGFGSFPDLEILAGTVYLILKGDQPPNGLKQKVVEIDGASEFELDKVA